MLIPVQTFFESLPEKYCSACDQPLEEQADCYQNTCDSCNDTHYYSISSKHENHL